MNWYPSKYPLIINPYDSFMKKHLQHYGYFTGRNMAIKRFGFEPKKGYKSDSDDSDSESSTSDATTTANNNKVPFKPRTSRDMNESFKWWINQKDLYSLGLKDLDYQREPRWPIEMQVLPGRIKHISTMPNFTEPFYVKTGLEDTPMFMNDPKNKTVFYYNPLNCGYFVRSRIGGSREGCQKVSTDLGNETEKTLCFESRFESGNLMKAIKINDNEYQLYLRYDLYTSKHTQWYYFRVTNAKPNVTYRFTICNFLKSDSLYNMGMKPLMYSDFDAQTKNLGWRRWGSNIKYYKNNIKTEDPDGNLRQFYSLTWTCQFPNENDTYYFAHCYPYTYSDLQDYLKEIQEDPVRNKYCKIKVLCRTLAENLVHLITITNPTTNPEENKAKKGVVITSRVHPGETNASWMMKGFLDFLLGNSADAKLLRENFVFKIVPMLNPDGVIIGNYRCSLTGRDLNRNYKTLLKEAFPSTWNTREMIKRFAEEREIVVYCDLHGHSRKNNVFIYGCHNNQDPKKRFRERVFPAMMNKNAGNVFSYNSCKFKIQKNKEGTGRIVMWNMGIMNSFTMEATFCGSTLGKKAGLHFTTKDFESLGYYFCDTLLDYCDPDNTKTKIILNDIEVHFKDQLRKRMELRGIYVDNLNQIDLDSPNVNFDDISSGDDESDDGGSDSSADDGLPLHLEHLSKNLRQRKKRKLKTSKSFQNGKNPIKEQKDKQRSSSFKAAPPEPPKELDKRSLKPLGNTILPSHLTNNNQRPRSAKALNNGIPIFTHERAEERATKRYTSVQFPDPDMNLPQGTDLSSIHLRYTNPSAATPTGSTTGSTAQNQTLPNNHTHLCDQHKKRLSDFFLFRHLTSIEGFNIESKQRTESDGDASDDEAELEEETVDENNNPTQKSFLIKPTFEEYVNKYVLSKSVLLRNKSSGGNSGTQTPLPRTKVFNINSDAQPLEIKSISKDDNVNNNISINIDQNPYQINHINNNNNNYSNSQKDAYDFLPKNLMKQMNEKKVINLNNSQIGQIGAFNASATTLSSSSSSNQLINVNEFNVRKSSKFFRHPNQPSQNLSSATLGLNNPLYYNNNNNNNNNMKSGHPLSKGQHGYSSSSESQKQELNTSDLSTSVHHYSTPATIPLSTNTKTQIEKVARPSLTRQKFYK